MNIRKLEGNCIKKIEDLFEGWDETLIWSCLQGCMGSVWTLDKNNVDAAQLVIADFCFLAGTPKEELLRHKPKEHNSDFIIMVPQNEEWSRLIEKVYGNNAKRVERYAIKKEKDVFDIQKLNAIVEDVDVEYELKMIDEELFHATKMDKWSSDLCSQFGTYDDYYKRGIGAVALYKGVIVAGASSYTIYDDGIEIEIDTREDYRRKGLALACGAKLILECLDRNLYPSWDAQNKGSVALAEKLGYHFDKEYVAYEVYNY